MKKRRFRFKGDVIHGKLGYGVYKQSKRIGYLIRVCSMPRHWWGSHDGKSWIVSGRTRNEAAEELAVFVKFLANGCRLSKAAFRKWQRRKEGKR